MEEDIVEFHFAGIEDLGKIISTYNSSIPYRLATADLEPVSVESKIAWYHAHDKERRPLWIVQRKGEYAGWMSFNSFYGRPAYDGTVEVSIYLENHFQGKGIGKKCLQKALSSAPSMNIHTLLGFIFAHNAASLKLFEKLGFKQWAKLPEVANMDGIMRDLVILGFKV